VTRHGRSRLSVDASKNGWIGIVLDGDDVGAVAAATIAEIVALAEVDGGMTAIGIDIPIGLSNTSLRQADLLARGLIGPRRSSVFTTPVRAALEAADHATAVALNRQATGQGVSIQAYGLRAKILQVDAWLSRSGRRVAEVHPEVCFARMAGRPLQDSKTTWAGTEHRRALLAAEGIRVPADLGAAGRGAAVDDVLDAAAVAWTARRLVTGRAVPIPDPPELLDDGRRCAIWV
jgi:predicted RNase H-like nuclease